MPKNKQDLIGFYYFIFILIIIYLKGPPGTGKTTSAKIIA
jgi:hypothetical protein